MSEIETKINLLRDMIKKASQDAVINSLARTVIGSPGGLDGIVRAYDFVKNKVKFVPEPFGQDNYQYPSYTLRTGFGDCEDHVGLLGSLLKAQGYEVGIKLVPRGGNRYHVYTVVKTPYGWLPLDTTIKSPIGTEVKARWAKIYPV